MKEASKSGLGGGESQNKYMRGETEGPAAGNTDKTAQGNVWLPEEKSGPASETVWLGSC